MDNLPENLCLSISCAFPCCHMLPQRITLGSTKNHSMNMDCRLLSKISDIGLTKPIKLPVSTYFSHP